MQGITARFIENEIKIHSSLHHPNIIQLYGRIETKQGIILVLEYADNGNLFCMLKKNIKLREIKAYHYFANICEGIRYLHEKNLIHRDIKPENILLNKGGSVKICDFGWSTRGDTSRSTYCGTLAYMAPEIINGCSYTNKVDIWALGVLLYEMIQGSTSFLSPRKHEKIQRTADSINFSSNFSHSARKLIEKLLDEDPSKRATIQEVFEHEWMLRYSLDQSDLEKGMALRQSEGHAINGNVGMQKVDYYESKLSKNYPVSYKRRRIASAQIDQETINNILDVSDNYGTCMFEQSNIETTRQSKRTLAISEVDIKEREKELQVLQRRLEGPTPRIVKNTSFYKKILTALNLN